MGGLVGDGVDDFVGWSLEVEEAFGDPGEGGCGGDEGPGDPEGGVGARAAEEEERGVRRLP